MKAQTYLMALILSGFVYFLFAASMSVSAGLDSTGPLISVGFAIIIFSFLSWFHFYRSHIGAVLLTVAIFGMYLTWPVHLLIGYFTASELKPSPIEFLTPLVLGALTIYLVWKSKSDDLNKWVKLILAIPPAFCGLYVVVHMMLLLL